MNASRTEKTKDTFLTPPKILDPARRMGPFGLDPASNHQNPTGARIWCVAPDAPIMATHGLVGQQCLVDGLVQNWAALLEPGELVWMNPPFGHAKLAFLTKCAEEYARGAEIQCIVPCDPATTWWQKHASPRLSAAAACCHLRQRPAFLDPATGRPPLDDKGREQGAMFGCCIVYWGERVGEFADNWAAMGDVDTGWSIR